MVAAGHLIVVSHGEGFPVAIVHVPFIPGLAVPVGVDVLEAANLHPCHGAQDEHEALVVEVAAARNHVFHVRSVARGERVYT